MMVKARPENPTFSYASNVLLMMNLDCTKIKCFIFSLNCFRRAVKPEFRYNVFHMSPNITVISPQSRNLCIKYLMRFSCIDFHIVHFFLGKKRICIFFFMLDFATVDRQMGDVLHNPDIDNTGTTFFENNKKHRAIFCRRETTNKTRIINRGIDLCLY